MAGKKNPAFPLCKSPEIKTVYNLIRLIKMVVCIIALFVFTMGRYRMTEAHGKILKGISGALMLALGLLMLLYPEALIFN